MIIRPNDHKLKEWFLNHYLDNDKCEIIYDDRDQVLEIWGKYNLNLVGVKKELTNV